MMILWDHYVTVSLGTMGSVELCAAYSKERTGVSHLSDPRGWQIIRENPVRLILLKPSSLDYISMGWSLDFTHSVRENMGYFERKVGLGTIFGTYLSYCDQMSIHKLCPCLVRLFAFRMFVS